MTARGKIFAAASLVVSLALVGCGSSGDETGQPLVDAGLQVDVGLFDGTGVDVRTDASDGAAPDALVDAQADATDAQADATDAAADATADAATDATADAATDATADAADAAVADALPSPDGAVKLPSGGAVAGGSVAHSAAYTLISTVGDVGSPRGLTSSPKYRLHGGVVGANGAKP